jgi:hypothetical protein
VIRDRERSVDYNTRDKIGRSRSVVPKLGRRIDVISTRYEKEGAAEADVVELI